MEHKPEEAKKPGREELKKDISESVQDAIKKTKGKKGKAKRGRKSRYDDMSAKELYDMVNDPHEFTNLAGKPKVAAVKSALKKSLPRINKKPVPGSANRILIYENGVANWEGDDIDPGEAIPD